MKISVIIPTYNEEKNIKPLYKRLKKVLDKSTNTYELIYINDGSEDSTLNALKRLRKKDKKIKIISFSRNFGHMSAVSAGINHAQGDKVVVMDADLQDPPELIPKLLEKSKKFDIVYATKKERDEHPLKKLSFSFFYKIITRLARIDMPMNAGTYSVIDQKVADVIKTLPERNKYFSGLRAWTGFTHTGVDYNRPKRKYGKPAPYSRLIKLAFDGIVSFSHLPLRLASYLGIIFSFISFILIIIVLVSRFVFERGIVGWASTMTTVLFIGGIQLITLGIIGEYLARIYDEVKNRPEYVVSEKEGFKN